MHRRVVPLPAQRFTRLSTLASFLGADPSTLRRDARTGVLRASRLPLHYTDERPRAGAANRPWVVYESDVNAYLDKIRRGLRLPIGCFRRQ